MVTQFEAKRKEIAAKIGETETRIGVLPTALGSQLMQQGVIVQLHIGRFRGLRKITREDLGLGELSEAEYNFFSDYISLGQKKLLPPRITRGFDRIEGRARDALEEHSYQTAWGRFVPCTAYPKWKARIEGLKSEYFELRSTFLADLDAVKEEVRTIYGQAAMVAYKRINTIPVDKDLKVPEAFVEDFADRVVGLIPTAEGLYASFVFDYFPFLIPLPALMDEEAKRTAMNEVLGERYLKEKAQLIDEFLVDIQKQLHGLVYDVATGVLRAIKNNEGKLLGPSAVQLKNLVAQVNQLNFFSDEKLGRLVDQVKSQIDRDAPKRDVPEIQTTLNALKVLTRTTLLDLSRIERVGRGDEMEVVVATEIPRQRRDEDFTETVELLESTRQMRLPLEVGEPI